eukprot:364487-Chlamydomonas_euryale.AAC.39
MRHPPWRSFCWKALVEAPRPAGGSSIKAAMEECDADVLGSANQPSLWMIDRWCKRQHKVQQHAESGYSYREGGQSCLM